MLQAKNVSKTYNAGKKIALQDFSIEVPTGSVYGLLGPMEPEKPVSSASSIRLHKLIQAKFSLTEKNLILIILKTLVICPKKEVFIKI